MMLRAPHLQRCASWPSAPLTPQLLRIAKPTFPTRAVLSHSENRCVVACSFYRPRASAAREVHARSSRSRKPTVAVRASWGSPVEFQTAKVLQNKESSPGLHQLLLDVGHLAAGYTKPGQFIQAKVGADAKPGFFAIASPPDVNNQGVLELLVKKVPGGAAEALCGLQAGSQLLVSPVQGKGFPVDKIPPSDYPTVLLFATGSGISPIKAVIESGALELPKRKEVRLYYGTRSEDTTAYRDLISTWSALGVKVVQVHSSKGGDVKYVQDALAADGPLDDPKGTGVLMCGQKDMCSAVTAHLQPQGVDHLLLNF